MENINITLAANILKYRKKSGLSQEELANKLGVTFQAVSKWENAKAAPDIAFLPMMADVFECSIDDLFSYMPKSKREALNILPGDSVPEGMKKYIGDQVKYQLDHNGSTDAFLGIMAEKLYMQTDDRVKIGDKPMKHTDSKRQELHDRHVKNRKELLKQYKN